jgi:hypothetical protein
MILRVIVASVANGAGFSFTSLVRADVLLLFVFLYEVRNLTPSWIVVRWNNFGENLRKYGSSASKFEFVNRHCGDVMRCLWNERRL